MEPDLQFWEDERQRKYEEDEEGELFDGYFSEQILTPSGETFIPRYEMLNYWLPALGELEPGEKRNDKDVLRSYEVPSNPVASANTDMVTDFLRWRNYVQIRDAGQKLDEVKHDLDNGRDMSREEAGVLLRNAYEELKNVYERAEEFEHDGLHLVYSGESVKPFLEYVERLAGHLVDLKWEIEKLDRVLEPENSPGQFDVHKHLEPETSEIDGSIDITSVAETKKASAD